MQSFMDRLHEAEQREQGAKNESERQAQYMKVIFIFVKKRNSKNRYTFWLKGRCELEPGFCLVFHPVQNLHYLKSSGSLVI